MRPNEKWAELIGFLMAEEGIAGDVCRSRQTNASARTSWPS